MDLWPRLATENHRSRLAIQRASRGRALIIIAFAALGALVVTLSEDGVKAGILCRLLSRGAPRGYGTNLMPTVLPRRQTTSQLRPVLASRENASRNLAGSE